MIGRSMSKALMRTRVATRSGSGVGVGGAGVDENRMGGSVICGEGVATAPLLGAGDAVGAGSAADRAV